MKKIFLVIFIVLAVVSCRKTEFDPEGPTDIRINNTTSSAFTDLTVTMSDTTINYGDIPAQGISDYHRFPKAFPKAEITCSIDEEIYSTGPAPDIYMQYLGQNRVTYVVYISNATNRELAINDVIYEESLVLEDDTEQENTDSK